SSDKLEIGDMPFVTAALKPVRNDALAYYREVVRRKELRIHAYEAVFDIVPQEDFIMVNSRDKSGNIQTYEAKNVVVATGYYDQPNRMAVPGENLPHVTHYFKEAHPYYGTDTVIIGGKNSAID